MKKKIFVLGYFGYMSNQLDGQTIKTRNIYKLLHSHESEFKYIKYFDTQQFQKTKLLIIKLLSEIIKCNTLIIIPAQNSLTYIFPVVYLISKIKNIKILYVAVGGWLVEFLGTKKLHVSLLSNVRCIFVQSSHLKDLLISSYSFNNVVAFPNFRIHQFTPTFLENAKKFKIVFMARINRLKGLDVVFSLAEYIEKSDSLKATIIMDFYGPIDKNDEGHFNTLVEKFCFVSYKGILQPDDIYKTLNQYDVLALPTKYFTEGFPGSILDAYISGIPVVVSQWKYAAEFVENEVTGYIFPFENGEKDFIDCVMKLYHDRVQLQNMKRKAYARSRLYSSDKAWNIMKNYM